MTNALATPEDVRNVVSTQLSPNLIVFSTSLSLVADMANKYCRLANLAIDDKEQYSELVKAIADVKSHRSITKKEKDEYKRPALDWNTSAEFKAKQITAPLKLIEDDLRAEKKRIDDIVAENKAAIKEAELRAKQLQADRLNDLRNLYADTRNMSIESIKDALECLPISKDLTVADYGDYLENAVTALNQVRMRLNGAIVQAEQALELKRQQEQQEADNNAKAEQDAEKNRIAADEKAAQQKVIDDLKKQNAKLQESAKPKEDTNTQVNYMSDAEFADNLGLTDSVINIAPSIDDNDVNHLRSFINDMKTCANFPPKLVDGDLQDACNRVTNNLINACGYLDKAITDYQSKSES